MFNADAQLK